MKTISTLLAFFFLTTSLFASGTRSTASLTVRSANKAAIVVVVDNKRYDLGTNSIMISDLDACEHDITVYQEKIDYPANCVEKKYDMLYNSSVELNPRTNLQISIDDCGITTMNEIKLKASKIGDTWRPAAYDDYNSTTNNNVYSKAMNSTEFSRVMWAISKESFDANKMKSAEQIIHTNYLTVDEVKQLLQLFCSDENKLELAKLAYEKTIDQPGYYALNDLFKFNTSKDELARCIRSH